MTSRPTPWSTGTKVLVGFGLVLALMAALGTVSYRSMAALQKTLAWEVHTHEVLNELNHVVFELQAAEIGLLQFTLSGLPHGEDAYRAARSAVAAELEALRALTVDNTQQQSRLDQLEPMVHAHLARLDMLLEQRRDAGSAAPVSALAAPNGGADIRHLIGELIEEENGLLARRSAAAEASARRAQAIITAGSLLALAFVAFAVYAIRRDLRLRRQAEQALRCTLDDLERRVVERTERISEANAELRREVAERQRTETELQRSHEDLLSILDRLRCASMVTDRDGRVAFLSRVAQHLCSALGGQTLGVPWQELPLFAAADRTRLQEMASRPAARRAKVPIAIETPSGRRYRMEVEIEDDPRDPLRTMFFIYDVSEVCDLRRLLDERGHFHGLVGRGPAMQAIFQRIRDLAAVDATVLIEGETGTGKELVARALHSESRRRDGPFIAVNCAGMTESLLGSQLFGHRKGAFTDAIADHQGVFEAANGGTILLDEIGDIPQSVQVSLLRVLQEREITRLGESRPRRIDVRVIAATHHDLLRDVHAGSFRSDLYYRVRVARIVVPPLHERREDVPWLVARFLADLRAATAKPVHDLSAEAMRVLLAQPWPGNVRELRSAIECAVIGCKGEVLQAEDLLPELARIEPVAVSSAKADLNSSDEGQRYHAALALSGGNRSAAARLLGVSRATFYRRWLLLQGVSGTPDEQSPETHLRH